MDKRGRPRKDESVLLQKKLNGWGLVCSTISINTKLSSPKLEKHLGVGNGTGRSWNNWKSGGQLPDYHLRKKVVIEAVSEGWLSTLTASEMADLYELELIHWGDVCTGEIRQAEEEAIGQMMDVLRKGILSPFLLEQCVDSARKELRLSYHQRFN